MIPLHDERLWELYREERNKLSFLPDADDDFIALDKAIERRFQEMKEQNK